MAACAGPDFEVEGGGVGGVEDEGGGEVETGFGWEDRVRGVVEEVGGRWVDDEEGGFGMPSEHMYKTSALD